MTKIAFSLLFILFIASYAYSQQNEYVRDTSYTISSAYHKIKKDYPQVVAIKPVKSEGVKEQRNIVYADVGRTLTLDIFYPVKKNRKGYPGILLIYGGGWSSGEKANQIPMAEKLAAKGFVAVVPEYRLSPEQTYPAAVYDLKATVRWMRAHARTYQLDTSRIAALGCSAGAQLATLLGVTSNNNKLEGDEGELNYSSAVQAIVNIDGIVSFIHPEAEEGEYAAKWLGGSKDDKPEVWKEASPLEYVGKGTPPTLFINSAQRRFHAGRDDMITILTKYGIYNETHTLENTPHSFWMVHPWFDQTFDYVYMFLKKVL